MTDEATERRHGDLILATQMREGFEGVREDVAGLSEKFDIFAHGNGGVGVKVRLDRLEVWRGRKDAVARVVGTTLIVSACGLPFYLLRLPLMNLIERLL